MRQHPIPQNILDVEFKLFTRFTLKEFAYLAIGLGLAGVMVYLVVGKNIPGIIGIPIAIACGGAGIVLGIVPINEQDADVFIKNYINAITNPTQMVWLNNQMKEERIKPEVKPGTEGKLVEKSFKEKVNTIIGGGIQKKEAIVEDKTEEKVETPTPQASQQLVISDENRANYEFTIQSLDKLPGNINIWLYTGDMKPVPNVVTYMKDQNGKVLYANRTGQSGYFLTNKTWDKGVYYLEFYHPQYKFPKVEIIIQQTDHKLPIKIKTL